MTNFGAEVTSLIGEGPWIFVGVQNAVKVSSSFLVLFQCHDQVLYIVALHVS